jgi:hypothetical protein|tara:strand:+ start:262 stop:585 length:324 start_codon:yes stop_codon:yes gene_type:complete
MNEPNQPQENWEKAKEAFPIGADLTYLGIKMKVREHRASTPIQMPIMRKPSSSGVYATRESITVGWNEGGMIFDYADKNNVIHQMEFTTGEILRISAEPISNTKISQ